MQNINKQKTGFKFGLHRLTLVKEFYQTEFRDKRYKLILVQTETKEYYYSLRLYNNKTGRFIKQILIDIPVLRAIAGAMMSAYPPGVGGWR